MRSIRKLVAGLSGFIALPLAVQALAQGPAPQVPATKETPALTAGAAPSQGTTRAPLNAADVQAWLDGLIPYAIDRGKIAGAVVVVVRGDGPVLQKGYGYADIATRKPVTADATLFRPGSVSKLFTWTAVMQQVEAGKLNLDADVNSYLDFKIPPYEGKPITLRQIMTHTAGFEESYRYLISNDPKAAKSLKELMPLALPVRVTAPGTMPAYSNYATALAGYIVERVSGIPFDTYIEQRVFAPLGMTRSSFRQPLPAALQPFMSSGYPDVTQKAKPFEIVIPAPAGSLSATGADMAKFMMAHLNNGGPLLKPETTRMMHDYRAAGLGSLNTMALGFYEQKINGHRAIGHGGDTDWFHSDLFLFPEDDIGVFISVNSAGDAGAAHALRGALFRQFANRYLPGSEPNGRVDDATARQHVQLISGNYQSSRGAFTTFASVFGLLGQANVSATEDGKLSFPALDALAVGPRNWVEIAPFLWRDLNSGERLQAEVKDGKVVRFSIDTVAPFMMFTPVPASHNAAWLIPAMLLSVGILLLSALGWPLFALVRRKYAAQSPYEGRARTAFRVSRGFAIAALIIFAGWVALISALMADTGALGGRLDWLLTILRVGSPLVAIGLIGTAGWHLWLTFKARGRWVAKVAAVLLLLAALILAWVIVVGHLYGFAMVY